MIFDKHTDITVKKAIKLAITCGSEYVTPEHVLAAATEDPIFCKGNENVRREYKKFPG